MCDNERHGRERRPVSTFSPLGLFSLCSHDTKVLIYFMKPKSEAVVFNASVLFGDQGSELAGLRLRHPDLDDRGGRRRLAELFRSRGASYRVGTPIAGLLGIALAFWLAEGFSFSLFAFVGNGTIWRQSAVCSERFTGFLGSP